MGTYLKIAPQNTDVDFSSVTTDNFTTSAATGSFSGSFQGDGSGLTGLSVPTSSYAISASYAHNADLLDGKDSTTFATTGSNRFNGNQIITGSLTVTQPITGSLFGTASYALNTISASYAETASFANNFTVAGTLTAQKLIVQTVTSSIVYSSGSNIFGNELSDTQTFTGSVNITGSLSINGKDFINTSASFDTRILNNSSSIDLLSGSYLNSSASFDTRINNNSSSIAILSGSYLNSSASFDTRILNNSSSISILSGSYLNSSASFDTRINNNSSSISTLSSSFSVFSGSYNTGSFTGSFSGSLFGTASYAETASNILGGSATFIPYFIEDTKLANSAMYQIGSESIAINEINITTANPEALYVFQKNPTSINVISGKGNLNNYLQLNIQNTNQGISASSDIVATANNGSETINYIDMGINSENYNSGFIGEANDAYLYSTGRHLHIGNVSNYPVQIFAGGSNTDVHKKLELNPNNQHELTGSLNITEKLIVQGGITGSLFGTASYANFANTASYALNTTSASYANNSTSSSYADNATSASYAINATSASYVLNAVSASYANNSTSSSYADNATSASYAISASYLIGEVTIDSSSFATTGSNIFIGNQTITGSLNVTQGITGSLLGTSSYANLAQTASYVLNAVSASYATQALSSSFSNTSISSSYAESSSYASQALSSSYAENSTSASYAALANTASYADVSATSSYADNFTVANTLTAQTLVVQTVSSSIVYSSGSNIFGNSLSNTQILTGSVLVTGSLSVNNSNVILTNQTSSMSVLSSSYAVSSSQATNAVTASYALNALSSSYSVNSTSASYSLNSDLLDGKDSTTFATTGSNIFVGNQIVTGSLFTTGSNTLIGSTTLTGSLNITGSTTQIGNNTLIGNTTLSGSLIISGTLGSPSNPNTKIYGDIETNGVVKFMPVSTNIDTSISASYIYVSGSTNDLYFSQNSNGYANTTRLRWLEGNLYTGLLHGGRITATTGSTTFNLSSGSGVVVNLNASLTENPYPTITYVNWDNFNNVPLTYLTSSIQSYIGIDSAGNVTQQNIAFNAGTYNEIITIGTVLHQNKATVNATITYPNVAYGYKQRTYDFIKAFGPLKLSGLTIIPSGSLGLEVGSGTAFADGRNYQVDPNNPSYITDPGTTVSKIFRYYQSGSEFIQDTNNGLGYTLLDPANYNPDGLGVLTPVPGTGTNRRWSIQRVFWYPNSATKGIVVYYGSSTYANEVDAAANISYEQFVEVENTKQNAVYLGAIVIRNNGDFTDNTSYRLLPGGIFRNVGGSGGGGEITSLLLSQLGDVLISGPQDGQPLVYNNTDAKWENKSFISASISGNASTATSASYAATASYVLNAVSSSFATNATNATTASYVLQAVSSSFATNASTASYVLNAVSSSFATNASTASYVLNAVSSSFATNASTASYVLNAVSSSFATNAENAATASYVLNAVSASFASTASSADNFTVRGTLTAQTIVAQTITSSTDFVTGSTRFGSLLSNTHQFTGSVGVTGSLALNGTSVTTGTGANGQVAFWNGTNTQTGSNNLSWDNTNNRLNVGVASSFPWSGARLEVINQMRIFDSASSSFGLRFGFNSNVPFLQGFRETVGVVNLQLQPSGGNVLINTTTDAGFRLDVNGTARITSTLQTDADAVVNGVNIGRGAGNIASNTRVGLSSLLSNTTGASNTAVGNAAGRTNTTGNNNSYFGRAAGENNTTGNNNSYFGTAAGTNNNGNNNSFFGREASSSNTTGVSNTAIGHRAGNGNTIGSRNVFLGESSGTTSNADNSIFLGFNAAALATDQTNQIVIGHSAIGLGSNTTVLGNSSTLSTAIYGNLLLGTTTDAGFRLDVNGTFRQTGSTTASGAIARGSLISPTLVAAANNDVLVGLDIAPTFTNGAFSVSNFALRTSGIIVPSVDSNIALGAANFRFSGIHVRSILAGANTLDINGSNINLNDASGNNRFRVFGSTGNVLIQNGGTFTDAGFRLDVNGTARIQGNTIITGSLTVVTGSAVELQVTPTGVNIGSVITDNHNVTGSLLLSGSLTSTGTITAQTLVVQTVSSSIIYSSGSNVFGNSLSNTQVMTGSVSVTGSLTVNNSNVILSNQTSSMSVLSSSFAATSSYSDNFRIGSTLILDQTLTDYATVASSIAGSNNLFTQATGSYTSVFIKYTATNGSNTRAGEVIAAWNGANTTFTDFSTVDLGITNAVTASVSIVTAQVQFNIQTNSSGWRLKAMATFI